MLSKLAKLKLMYEIMESTLLRKHTYMQMLIANKKLLDEGTIMPWFNFAKFYHYESPVEQLTVFEKEMLFRNFYSFQRIEEYVDTWYMNHAHLIKAFRTQKGWNESEFYLNLNETVDTPVSLLNAYRDFTLLSYFYTDQKPRFTSGLPRYHYAPSLDISQLFINVYNKVINEGLINFTTRLSDAKFKKISPLLLSGPVQLSIKDEFTSIINSGKACDLASKNLSDDNFKLAFGCDFHNFLPFVYKEFITISKTNYLALVKRDGVDISPSDYITELFSSGIKSLKEHYLNLISNNKELFIGYLLKYLNAGNRNITKQTILNKLSTFVHQFNSLFNMYQVTNLFLTSRYNHTRNFNSRLYNIDDGETEAFSAKDFPSSYVPPFDFDKSSTNLSDNTFYNVRTFYLFDNLTYDSFVKFINKEVSYTSVTTSKTRLSNHRFAITNLKKWSQFITDLNEYLNFKSDNKNFLINLHPVALFNASLGYGGWSSCHHYITNPTKQMIELSTGDEEKFPSSHHPYWFGNYQLALGNAFVIVEPPFVVAEKQYYIPNKVRTIAWVAEDYSSIRMNMPYPTKQSGDIPDEMYLEYTAIRERMASIFKPFISVPEPHTWLRVSKSGINSHNTAEITSSHGTFFSDVVQNDPIGNNCGRYLGFSGEYLQSASVLKEIVNQFTNKTSVLIHSSDFRPFNNEKLTNGCASEDLSEVNTSDVVYSQSGGLSSSTYISRYTRPFSNSENLAIDTVSSLSFNKNYLLQLDNGDYISYATYLSNVDKFFFCQDTALFSTEAIKVFIDKSKNFSYFSKNFTEAVLCNVSKEYYLPHLMVGDISIFESLKQSQVEWTFIFDSFINRKLVLVHDDLDLLNNFLDNLTSKTNYKWASGKAPNEYHFDTTKAIVFSDGVLKLKSIDDLEGYQIVDVKNVVFKL